MFIISVTTLIAICALVVSVFSTSLAAWTAFAQRKHMQLSVKPIATVFSENYEDRVGVYLKNNGLGPMRISSFRVTNDAGESHTDIVSHMPNITWSDFCRGIDGSTLKAGSQLNLLLLEGSLENSAYLTVRNEVRKSLSELVVIVEYEDIYGRRMDAIKETLSYFDKDVRKQN